MPSLWKSSPQTLEPHWIVAAGARVTLRANTVRSAFIAFGVLAFRLSRLVRGEWDWHRIGGVGVSDVVDRTPVSGELVEGIPV